MIDVRNGPRMFGMVCEWAVMLLPPSPSSTRERHVSGTSSRAAVASSTGTAVVVNFYGALSVAIPNVGTLVQDTKYPYDSTVKVSFTPDAATSATTATTVTAAAAATTATSTATANPAAPANPVAVHFRIPCWSQHTTIQVNDEPAVSGTPGTYYILNRVWAATDIVTLDFDFRLRAWKFGQDFSKQDQLRRHGDAPAAAATATTVASPTLMPSPHEATPLPAVPPPPLMVAPVPEWDSTVDGKWVPEGKNFNGKADCAIAINPTQVARKNAPTTMMGWFAVNTADVGDASPGVAFSFGAGKRATPNMARALSMYAGNCDMYNGGGPNDVTNILNDDQHMALWIGALGSEKWHHVAIVDSSTLITIILDGVVVGTKAFSDPTRNTQGGYMVGGWADDGSDNRQVGVGGVVA